MNKQKRNKSEENGDGKVIDAEERLKGAKKRKLIKYGKKSSITKARALYESAFQHWLYPKQESDYEVKVKTLLRKCIKVLEEDLDGIESEEDQQAKMSLHTQTSDALTLYSIQRTKYKPKEVRGLLAENGYVARLSKDVLRYELPSKGSEVDADIQNIPADITTCPCRAYDGALSQEDLQILMNALCPLNASYWKDHSYCVYPPTPYFSYVFDLKEKTLKNLGALGNHVKNVQRLSSELIDSTDDGEVPKYAEIWAHHRPHCSGHQLHFDSDNEGRGEVKHPLVSSIIYLSDEGCGGPSLITDQRLGDTQLAQNGWLTHPKKNRLVLFDGSVLHGVIPGRGYVGGRHRVTLMVALWKDIRIRKGDEPGAARPLPNISPGKNAGTVPQWFTNLTRGDKKEGAGSSKAKKQENSPKKIEPIPLDCVFSTISGKKIKEGRLPAYDTVFQGF